MKLKGRDGVEKTTKCNIADFFAYKVDGHNIIYLN